MNCSQCENHINVKLDFDPILDYIMNYATVKINIQMTFIISIHNLLI